eukprot:2720990-Pleurochrysis_carterae.AAC.5
MSKEPSLVRAEVRPIRFFCETSNAAIAATVLLPTASNQKAMGCKHQIQSEHKHSTSKNNNSQCAGGRAY